MPKITPFLWFDTEAEEAAKHYTSIFPNSRITDVTHYGWAGPSEAGTVMTVAFELDGQPFIALNGGPEYRFTEAVSSPSAARRRRRSTSTGASSPTAARKGPAGG